MSTFARQSVDQTPPMCWGTDRVPQHRGGITPVPRHRRGIDVPAPVPQRPEPPQPLRVQPVRAVPAPVRRAPGARRRSGAQQRARSDLGSDDGALSAAGAADRIRVDQHLESIRALELRIAAGAVIGDPGKQPADVPDVGGLEQITEKNEVMTELMKLALVCDLTGCSASSSAPADRGSSSGRWGDRWHAPDVPHRGTPPADGQRRHHPDHGAPRPLPADLRDTPEGAGNLLDHSAILATTELSDGWTHANTDFPILVAGLGNGRLKGGVHYRPCSTATRATPC